MQLFLLWLWCLPCIRSVTLCSVYSSYLLGGFTPPPLHPRPESLIPPEKQPKHTQKWKKCITFTPSICGSPQNTESRFHTARCVYARCLRCRADRSGSRMFFNILWMSRNIQFLESRYLEPVWMMVVKMTSHKLACFVILLTTVYTKTSECAYYSPFLYEVIIIYYRLL